MLWPCTNFVLLDWRFSSQAVNPLLANQQESALWSCGTPKHSCARSLCQACTILPNIQATADLSEDVSTDRVLTSQGWHDTATDCPGVQISLALGVAAKTAALMVQNEM